ncbi:MAG: helix-turn-helix domain-containing protein [Bdellovibrionota bacterium]
MAKPNSKITDVLVAFGLTDVEAEVYQSALALGSRQASVIAQKAGLKRGHAYNVLQSLMQKGIVQEFVKNGVKQFTCSPPSSLLSIAENRERELKKQKDQLEQILPELESLRNPLASQPKVRFYQGFEGIKEIFDDMLREENKEIHAIVDLQFTWSAVGKEGVEYVKTFIRRREERNIVWNAICVFSPESDKLLKTRPSALRKMKRIESMPCPAEVSIYGNKVAFTSTYKEMIGVVVENEPIAETIRNIFLQLWKTLPDYDVQYDKA